MQIEQVVPVYSAFVPMAVLVISSSDKKVSEMISSTEAAADDAFEAKLVINNPGKVVAIY